jgi:hypothetical protein
MGGHAEPIGHLGYRVATIHDLAHGFVFEFGGISFRTHGLSPMAIRTPEFVYQTGESPKPLVLQRGLSPSAHGGQPGFT